MKSPRYRVLKSLYDDALKTLHDRSHPVVQSIEVELEKETLLSYRRELYLFRYKYGLITTQPIKFKTL